ncbi:hypothetical protein AAF712_010660 [Marasmius tenuissimus]|uniref:Non-specific serine/threonine protein kinase n=1 Tax=Marasmius tenuissimus TaxID=585030 RepID=A0ABR2ZNY8_9AGAR
MVRCPGDGGGYNCGRTNSPLHRAFLASLVLSKRIRTDLRTWIRQTSVVPIAIEDYALPSIIRIQNLHFQIDKKLGIDEAPSYVYLAKLTQLSNLLPARKRVIVKFTQTYSRALHEFCASKGMAPALLGYEELPGGWIGVVMDHLPNVYPLTSPAFSLQEKEERWKKIEGLVRDMHDAGYVHGDLCESNILSAKGSEKDNAPVWIIDFDWGGENGKVSYPYASLDRRLLDGRTGNDLVIRKEDDERVMGNTRRRIFGAGSDMLPLCVQVRVVQ